MSTTSPKPKTLEGVKRLARRLKAESGLTHARALDKAAVIAGHPNFKSMKRTLDREAQAPTASRFAASRKGPTNMTHEEYRVHNLAAWDAATETLELTSGQSKTWRGPTEIAKTLEPILARNLNHGLLPTGGGHDLLGVRASTEPGCLEVRVSERTAYIVKPKTLTFEKLEAEGQSFFLLELDALEPSGVYEVGGEEDGEVSEDRPAYIRDSEELLELHPGEYVNREVWDRGFSHYTEDGSEAPFSSSARIVVRWFGGKFLIVAKASLWNSASETYDGRHNRMTSAQIRDVIERSL